MCGIVGVAGTGPASHQMKEFFQSLLLHDVVRGFHATGVAAIDTLDRSLTVMKKAVPSPDFLSDDTQMEPLFNFKHNFNIYIGHNRWATSGAKDDDANAHPFIHGDIVGVHNGSLRNQRLLDDSKDFKVDSDNIFYHMNKNGLDNTLEKLNGAFVLVWYDKKDNTLNFIRNDERPLCIAKLSNGYYVWASEKGMLDWLIKRHKQLSYATYEEEDANGQKVKYNHVFNLAKNTHLKVAFKDHTRQYDGEPVAVAKTLPTFPTSDYYGSGQSWGNDYRNNSNRSTRNGNQSNTPPVTSYQTKVQAHLDKFLTNGKQAESSLQVKFLGIEKETTSTGYVATIALFEFNANNGKRVITHAFVHAHAGILNDLTEKDIGKTFYGTVSTINDITAASYKCSVNEEMGFTISLNQLSTKQPNRFFAYCDGKGEGESAQNVLPFRGKQQKTPSTGTKGSGKSAQDRSSRDSDIQARIDILLGEENKNTDKGFMGRSVVTATTICTQGEYIGFIEENGPMCSNCGGKITEIPINRVYHYAHFDASANKTHNYLSCKKACHNLTVAVCDELDKDFEAQFGGIYD